MTDRDMTDRDKTDTDMTDPEMTSTLVAAVVPAFDPPGNLADLVADLRAQTGRVVVVDDGSPDAGTGQVLVACADAGAVVLRHEINSGIAAALNTAVAEARSRWPEVTAILTVDQDSRLGTDHVDRLVAAWRTAVADGLAVALVGPEHVEGLPSMVRRGWSGRSGRQGLPGVLPGREPVQSGLLVPTAVLDRVGAFDESLVIDGVDTDFFLRCLDAGGEVVVAPGTTIGHRLGTGHPVRLLGRPVVVAGRPLVLTVSAPLRYYYLSRNRIRLVRRHGRRHTGWAVGQVVGLARHLLLVQTLVPGRRVRARELRHGLRDGLRDVGGRRPD